MSNKDVHSPTPWKAILDGEYSRIKSCDDYYIDSSDYETGMSLSEANADFICRAVNEYDKNKKLIKELSFMLNVALGYSDFREDYHKDVEELLAKAKGELHA